MPRDISVDEYSYNYYTTKLSIPDRFRLVIGKSLIKLPNSSHRPFLSGPACKTLEYGTRTVGYILVGLPFSFEHPFPGHALLPWIQVVSNTEQIHIWKVFWNPSLLPDMSRVDHIKNSTWNMFQIFPRKIAKTPGLRLSEHRSPSYRGMICWLFTCLSWVFARCSLLLLWSDFGLVWFSHTRPNLSPFFRSPFSWTLAVAEDMSCVYLRPTHLWKIFQVLWTNLMAHHLRGFSHAWVKLLSGAPRSSYDSLACASLCFGFLVLYPLSNKGLKYKQFHTDALALRTYAYHSSTCYMHPWTLIFFGAHYFIEFFLPT